MALRLDSLTSYVETSLLNGEGTVIKSCSVQVAAKPYGSMAITLIEWKSSCAPMWKLVTLVLNVQSRNSMCSASG
jgi:hypothetical protein